MSACWPPPLRTVLLSLLALPLLVGCATAGSTRAPAPHKAEAPAKAEQEEAPAPTRAIESLVAGKVALGGLMDPQAFYLVDRQTQTCWFLLGATSPSPLSCCALRRHPRARRLITWESAESCGASGTEPPPPPAPRGGVL